jgi:hypothetical protein
MKTPKGTEKKEEFKEKYYFKVFSKSIPIPFDRLQLEDLLDRDFTVWEFLSSIILATLVSWFSYRLISSIDDYFLIFSLYVSVASSQFSLLKSPQPDGNFCEFNESSTFTTTLFENYCIQ